MLSQRGVVPEVCNVDETFAVKSDALRPLEARGVTHAGGKTLSLFAHHRSALAVRTPPLILPNAMVAPVAHEHTVAALLRQLAGAMEARLVVVAPLEHLCDACLRRVSFKRMQEEHRLGVHEELAALARSDAPDIPSGQLDRRHAHLDR